jgi:tetratricopeptide (TPR) repeat protein
MYERRKIMSSTSNDRDRLPNNKLLEGIANLKWNMSGAMSFFHQESSSQSASARSKQDGSMSNAQVGFSIYKFGNTLASSNEWEEALLAWQNALEIFKSSCGEKHITVAKTLNKIGVAYCALEEPYNAYDSFTKALEIQQEILNPGDKQLTITLRNMSVLLSDTRTSMEDGSSSGKDAKHGASLCCRKRQSVTCTR